MKADFVRNISEYLKTGFDKYKYVCIVCAVGLLLALWPSGGKSEPAPDPPEQTAAANDASADAQHLALELEKAFAEIAGVGEVKVLLTVKSGYESVYAYDQSISQSAQSSQTQLVTISGGGEQSPVVRKINYPVFLGAVVICEGGENAKVKLELTQAIRSLTGITSDNISIIKMKK